MTDIIPQAELTQLGRRAMIGRTKYLQGLNRLPKPIATIARTHYRKRVRRLSPKPLLGEYAPWLIADVLQIDSIQSIGRITGQWLHLYAGTLLLDDLIDEPPEAAGALRLITATVLMERGVSALLSDAASPRSLRRAIDRSFERTARAAFQELQGHRGRVVEFGGAEVSALGDKIGILQICIDALVDRFPDRSDRRGWASEVLGHLTQAIQLLDDVTDWEEDAAAGSFTLPHTVRVLRAFDRPSVRREDLLADLVKSGALREALEGVAAALQSTVNLLRERRATGGPAFRYVKSLHSSVRAAADVMKNAEAVLLQAAGSSQQLGVDRARDRALLQVEESLRIVAQGS